MTKLAELIKVFRRDYSDVVGVDFGLSGVKVVRLKRQGGKVALMAADLFPPVTFTGAVPPMSSVLVKPLRARYVALASSLPGSVVKLLTFPVNSDKTIEMHVSELMGITDLARFRVAYEIVHETRTEIRALAVALPDAIARAMCGLFPIGVPAPCSIEMSGVSSLTAFSEGVGANHQADCVALVEFGAAVTMVSFFSKGLLVLVRKFDFGSLNILKKLQDNLGIDQEVAAGILSDGSFDVSRIIHQAMEQFLQQLTISSDFVERRENVHVDKLYVGGGGVSLRLWMQEIEATTGHKPALWNPFDGLTVQSGAVPDKLIGQESRFGGAVGVALGVLKK